MSWLNEFQKAYDDFPSQDNEGYVPDRGAFKCGFSSAWHLQQQKIYAIEQSLGQAAITRDERWLIEGCLLARRLELEKIWQCAMAIGHEDLSALCKKDMQKVDALKKKLEECATHKAHVQGPKGD